MVLKSSPVFRSDESFFLPILLSHLQFRFSQLGFDWDCIVRAAEPSAAMRRCCGRRSKNAAIDDKLYSLDVSCIIRREKEDGAGYIFGPANAIERNHRLEATLACRSGVGRYGHSLPDRRFDNAGNNGVDSDTTR